MFAETDVFWKWPSVYDAISVVGLGFGLASIWYAWYLARRQLRADFKKAAEEAVDVLVRFALSGDLAEAVRFLREAERALAEKDWPLGLVRLDDAASTVARFCEHSRLTEGERDRLIKLVDRIRATNQQTRSHSRSTANRGHLPDTMSGSFGGMITELERLRGRLLTDIIRPIAGGK